MRPVLLAAAMCAAPWLAPAPRTQAQSPRVIDLRQTSALAGYVPCIVNVPLSGRQAPQTAAGAPCADAAPAIQRILDSVNCGSPAVLVFEIGYGVGSGLVIPNGPGGGCVTFQGRGWNSGLIALPGCNCTVINDGYPYSPGTWAPTRIQNVTIEDLTINGFAGPCAPAPCHTNARGSKNSGEPWLQDIALYNLENLLVSNVQTLASPTFSIVVGNVSHAIFRDGVVDQRGGGNENTDGIHVQGAYNDVTIENYTFANTGDDSVCLCLSEAAGGNGSGFLLRHIRLYNAYDILRIYGWPGSGATTYTNDYAVVEDVKGTVQAWAFNLNGVAVNGPFADNQYGRLRVRDVDITQTVRSTTQPFFNIVGKWSEVSCEFCIYRTPVNSYPMIALGVTDYHVQINLLTLVNSGVYRSAAGNLPQSPALIQLKNGSSIGRVVMENFYVMDDGGPFPPAPAALDVPAGNSVGTVEIYGPMNTTGRIASLLTPGSAAQVGSLAGADNFLATPTASCGTVTGNNTAGTILAAGSAGTCTLTMTGITANHGWSCAALVDRTTGASIPQTGGSASSAVFTGAIVEGHTLGYSCRAY